MTNKSTFNKFGKKMKELISLVESTENWKQFVEPNTITLIEDLIQMENISAVLEKNNTSYNNARAKYMIALHRIKEQKTDFIRLGGSQKAKKLFDLVDSTENWKKVLTDREISYVTEFRRHKNFYEAGRVLNISPSNIAGTLYGTTQKEGVISKLEKINNQHVN